MRMPLYFQEPARRQRWAAWLRREAADLRRRGWMLVVLAGAMWGLGQVFGICYVKQLSLPYPLWGYTLFAPAHVQRGDFVVVDLPPAVASHFPPGGTFIKEIVGVPGDLVQARDGVYTVLHGGDIVTVGLSKPVGRSGQALLPGPVGVIPPGRYFIRGTHPDSLDSRYAMMGWIETGRIIGTAAPILPAAAAQLWLSLGWTEQ